MIEHLSREAAGHDWRRGAERRITEHAPRGISRGTIAKASIAQLTVEAIAEMTDVDLARVVRTAQACPNAQKRLGCYDRGTLVRLVYLARQVCRRQGY